jgi:O-antigen/teichoic acid export membrane protein
MAILRQALPLGVVLMLAALSVNLPRYAIEHHLGVRELGIFAAAASFITAGSTMMNALGQAATSRMAHRFASGELGAFRKLGARLAAIGAALGVTGILASMAIGGWALDILYRPEYASYVPVLTALMASAVFTYAAISLGYVLTSTRTFAAQIPLLLAATVVSGAASLWLVPRSGLYGAAAALGLASLTQTGGYLFLIRRAVRQRASA